MKSSARLVSDSTASISLDSSVAVAYFLGEPLGQYARDHVFNSRREVYASHMAIAETGYVLCRQKGPRFAMDAIGLLKQTRYVTIPELENIDLVAGLYKCSRKISLADCYVLALAKESGSTALFARHETELDREAKRETFDVPITYLQDLVLKR